MRRLVSRTTSTFPLMVDDGREGVADEGPDPLVINLVIAFIGSIVVALIICAIPMFTTKRQKEVATNVNVAATTSTST
jgi:hypothetical protein